MVTLIRCSPSVAAILILAMLHFASAARGQSNDPTDALAKLEEIAKAYKVEIVTKPNFPIKTTYGNVDGKIADRKDLANYSTLFALEFQLYPPDLVKRSQLKGVVLCSELSFAGQRRNAIPDYEHDMLYLDVSRGSYSKPYMRKVIHHEFFHIIDYRDDGEVYKDERWERLNPPGLKYGRGGTNAQDLQETSVLTDKFPGFLNHYSTTAVEEDKAEVFANLIVSLAYVGERSKKDRVLKTKVERMKELLVVFCPEMNDTFWEKAQKANRSSN